MASRRGDWKQEEQTRSQPTNKKGASLQEGPTYTERAYAEGAAFSASNGYLITYATIGAQATSMATNTGTAQGKGVEA